MSATIHKVLDSFCELAAHIYQGNDTGNFVQHERCLFLADQLAACTPALSDEFRRGRLPEVSTLRALGTEGDFRARLLALDEAIHMAFDAAQDALRATARNDFPLARQRVSDGVYLLGRLNAALDVMRQPGFSPATAAVAAPVNPQRKTSK